MHCAGAGDGDFLTGRDSLQQAGEVRLSLMDVEFHAGMGRLSPWTKSTELVRGYGDAHDAIGEDAAA